MIKTEKDVQVRIFVCKKCIAKREESKTFVSDAKRPYCPICRSYRVVVHKELTFNSRRESMAKKIEKKVGVKEEVALQSEPQPAKVEKKSEVKAESEVEDFDPW